MAENPCPVYLGGHRMAVKGAVARVQDQHLNKVTELTGGNLYECTGCRENLITSGYPHFPGYYVGDYVTHGGIIKGEAQGTVWVFTINRSLMRNSQTPSLPGYNFL